jgi:signal transduction histidine kinase
MGAFFVMTSTAISGALDWYGRPVAGALIDPGGLISNVGPGDWSAKARGFGFPDKVTALEGRPLTSPEESPSRTWDRRIAALARSGRQTVDVTVTTRDGGTRRAEFELHTLDGATWWFLGPLTHLVGLLWCGAGMLALWFAPQSHLGRATAALGTSVGLFLVTLFDFHTSRRLVPLFFLGYATVPPAFVALGLRLPDDSAIIRRHRWIDKALVGVGVAMSGAFVVRWAAGDDTVTLQLVAGALLGLSFLVFVVTFVTRLVLSSGRHRRTMRTLAVAMVPPHALAASFAILGSLGIWSFSDLLMYPMLGLAPATTIYAVVRYDIWGSRALLSRPLMRIGVGTAVWLGATAVGIAVAAPFASDVRSAAVAAAVAGMFAAAVTTALLDVSDRVFFSSHAAYKPSVAELSTELTNTTSTDEVACAIERTVDKWLECEGVRLTLFDEPRERTSGDGQVGTRHRPRGWASERGGRVLDVGFAGVPLAELEVGPKPDGALFTSADLDLLVTIADQGGLALAHALAYEELERRRREQARAWRGEREALVETVAGEIAHEIRHPINFFRSVFDGAAAGEELDGEEIEVGREEIDRLERLVAGLRRLTGGRVERDGVPLVSLVERAERLLRDALAGRTMEIDIPEDVVVRCDLDKAIQILVNLLSNGLEATEEGGRVGVRWKRTPRRAELVIWDTGPGFDGDPARLFAPWHTTKEKGTGLGLAITYRLVRAHDWTVRAERVEDETHFVITIREEDIRTPELEMEVA